MDFESFSHPVSEFSERRINNPLNSSSSDFLFDPNPKDMIFSNASYPYIITTTRYTPVFSHSFQNPNVNNPNDNPSSLRDLDEEEIEINESKLNQKQKRKIQKSNKNNKDTHIDVQENHVENDSDEEKPKTKQKGDPKNMVYNFLQLIHDKYLKTLVRKCKYDDFLKGITCKLSDPISLQEIKSHFYSQKYHSLKSSRNIWMHKEFNSDRSNNLQVVVTKLTHHFLEEKHYEEWLTENCRLKKKGYPEAYRRAASQILEILDDPRIRSNF